MNTTTITNRRRWFASIAAVAATAAIASPIATGPAAADHSQRRSSIIDDEYSKVQSRPSGAENIATTEGRPCFIIQSHWNPAYDGFVPVCGRPGEKPVAEQAGCPPGIDTRYVGVPWVSSVRTGCQSRDRWWSDIAD